MNRGCVPSKALLAASGRVRELQNSMHLKAMGIQVTIPGMRIHFSLCVRSAHESDEGSPCCTTGQEQFIDARNAPQVGSVSYERQPIADHAINLASTIQLNLKRSLEALGVVGALETLHSHAFPSANHGMAQIVAIVQLHASFRQACGKPFPRMHLGQHIQIC